MIWLTNKYVQLLLVGVLIFPLGYYKGYSAKSDAVALQNYEDFKQTIEKLDKVYDYSVAQTADSKKYITITNSKLNNILTKIGELPLTSVPCEPTEEFTIKWNQLNDATTSNK